MFVYAVLDTWARRSPGPMTFAIHDMLHAPIRDVLRLANCRFSDVVQHSVIEHVEYLVLEDVIINGVRVG